MIARLRGAWFALKEWVFLRRHDTGGDRFAAIYRGRMWQNPETASGFGSTLAATGPLRDGLAALVGEHKIGSLLDAPCGDFNWQRKLEFSGDYLGIDVVPELIAENVRRFGGERRRFAVADIVADALPRAELVLSRECLNHLPLADGVHALGNLERAATRFLAVTHYPKVDQNLDQPASFRYRPLDLTRKPFAGREPDFIIDEGEFEPGKCVAVWALERAPAGFAAAERGARA